MYIKHGCSLSTRLAVHTCHPFHSVQHNTSRNCFTWNTAVPQWLGRTHQRKRYITITLEAGSRSQEPKHQPDLKAIAQLHEQSFPGTHLLNKSVHTHTHTHNMPEGGRSHYPTITVGGPLVQPAATTIKWHHERTPKNLKISPVKYHNCWVKADTQ